MRLSQENLEGSVCKVVLEGSLDLPASLQLDPQFRTIAEGERRVIVDISGVDFLASIGIRLFVVTARKIAEKGGRMSVYGAQEAPGRVLRSTGVETIVKLLDDEAAARAWVAI